VLAVDTGAGEGDEVRGPGGAGPINIAQPLIQTPSPRPYSKLGYGVSQLLRHYSV